MKMDGGMMERVRMYKGIENKRETVNKEDRGLKIHRMRETMYKRDKLSRPTPYSRVRLLRP